MRTSPADWAVVLAVLLYFFGNHVATDYPRFLEGVLAQSLDPGWFPGEELLLARDATVL